jgi:hypothetical protein
MIGEYTYKREVEGEEPPRGKSTVKVEAETKAQEGWQSPETGKGKEWKLSMSLQRPCCLPIPSHWISSL